MYNILIVDDEKIERNGIRLLLKRMGADFNIAEASNGKEALDYINAKKDSQDAPDILLTDVKMPFMDGIGLIKEVRNNNIHTKNIIFSGYNEFEYAKLAVRLGVVDYILKPVDPKEFENVINRVICELDSENMEKLTQSRRDDFIKEYLLYSMINGSNIQILELTDMTDLFSLNLMAIFLEKRLWILQMIFLKIYVVWRMSNILILTSSRRLYLCVRKQMTYMR